jgi:hypothetical protein
MGAAEKLYFYFFFSGCGVWMFAEEVEEAKTEENNKTKQKTA